jgi:hypothetical protein
MFCRKLPLPNAGVVTLCSEKVINSYKSSNICNPKEGIFQDRILQRNDQENIFYCSKNLIKFSKNRLKEFVELSVSNGKNGRKKKHQYSHPMESIVSHLPYKGKHFLSRSIPSIQKITYFKDHPNTNVVLTRSTNDVTKYQNSCDKYSSKASQGFHPTQHCFASSGFYFSY